MKSIRKQLGNDLNAIVEDIRFYDVRGQLDRVRAAEAQADFIKKQLNILSRIELEREGNLLHFNEDGTFELHCIRIPGGGDQIVEHYNATFNFEEYEELLETADCIDVTDTFDVSEYASRIFVADELPACGARRDIYYFVSNEVMEDAVIAAKDNASEFENFLVEKNDRIDNAAFGLINVLLDPEATASDEPVTEWNMEIIGNVVDLVQEYLEKRGMKTCHPYYEGDDRTPCSVCDSCENTRCTRKSDKTKEPTI